MKKIVFLLCIITLLPNVSYAQDYKTVTLTVSGQGKTQDDAKQNALRNAIEQAFGTFISSNTEILNDELVKDEIVSVSNGNIQKFEIFSEVQMPNGKWHNTLKATVSIDKLTEFVVSRGEEIKVQGGLFATNFLHQQMLEKNETLCLLDLSIILGEISNRSFDFNVEVNEPYVVQNPPNSYNIPVKVVSKGNSNLKIWSSIFYNTIRSISMEPIEVNDYERLGKKVYSFSVFKNSGKRKRKTTEVLYFRSEKSLLAINLIYNHLIFSLQNFLVKNDVRNYDINSSRKFACFNQTASSYLMDQFNYISLGRYGPNGLDGCNPCVYSYGRDHFYLTYRSANFNAWLKKDLSFYDIDRLTDKTAAVYEFCENLTLTELTTLNEYSIQRNDSYVEPIISLEWDSNSGHANKGARY